MSRISLWRRANACAHLDSVKDMKGLIRIVYSYNFECLHHLRLHDREKHNITQQSQMIRLSSLLLQLHSSIRWNSFAVAYFPLLWGPVHAFLSKSCDILGHPWTFIASAQLARCKIQSQQNIMPTGSTLYSHLDVDIRRTSTCSTPLAPRKRQPTRCSRRSGSCPYCCVVVTLLSKQFQHGTVDRVWQLNLGVFHLLQKKMLHCVSLMSRGSKPTKQVDVLRCNWQTTQEVVLVEGRSIQTKTLKRHDSFHQDFHAVTTEYCRILPNDHYDCWSLNKMSGKNGIRIVGVAGFGQVSREFNRASCSVWTHYDIMTCRCHHECLFSKCRHRCTV